MKKAKENISPVIPLTIVGGIAAVGGTIFWLMKKKKTVSYTPAYTPAYTPPAYTKPAQPPLYTEPKKPTFVQKIKNIFKPKTKALTNVLMKGKQYLQYLPKLSSKPRFPRSLVELNLWNQKKLQELQPGFKSKIMALLSRAKREQGMDLIIFEAYRPPEKQDVLYQQYLLYKRTKGKKGKKVTTIPPFVGGHSFGLATDTFPWQKGNTKLWSYPRETYKKYLRIAVSLGLYSLGMDRGWDWGHIEDKSRQPWMAVLTRISKQEYGIA